MTLHVKTHSVLSLSISAGFLAWGNCDQSLWQTSPHRCRGGLLCGGDANSVCLCDIANMVISWGHSKWCPDVPLVEFMYLVFTRMPGDSYHRWLRSLLLCLCDIFQALINSLACRCPTPNPLQSPEVFSTFQVVFVHVPQHREDLFQQGPGGSAQCKMFLFYNPPLL